MIVSRFALLALALVALAAHGQNYPARAIRVIYPFQTGGTGDIVLRLIMPVLEQRLGQRMVLEEKPGAGGNIGAQQVAAEARLWEKVIRTAGIRANQTSMQPVDRGAGIR